MRWPSIIPIMLLAGALNAETQHYVIDPQHLTIGFLVGHVGFAKVFGRFTEAEGSFDFDEKTGKISNVRVVVKTASVDTTVEPRDRHLRSGDFLNVEKYPEMTFVSEGTVLADGKGELRGNLTVIGVTRPIALEVTWNKSAVSPLPGNPYVAGMSARGSFDRSGYGMSYGLADGLVDDEVELIIELEAQRK